MTLAHWTSRRWAVAGATVVAYVVVVGVPTAMIPNPVFGREIPPTWWSWPALLTSAALAGLLAATYVASPAAVDEDELDRPTRTGLAGGMLTFFAVGCPVYNKLVLLALGTSGALNWFEPVQPLLQVAAIAALAWALRTRLRTESACVVPVAS